MEKFFLYLDEARLGIKYDTRCGELTVGSYGRFLNQIEGVMFDYFRVDPFNDIGCSRRWVQVNKVRLVAHVVRWQFVKGLGKLKAHGFTLQETTNLERIMR